MRKIGIEEYRNMSFLIKILDYQFLFHITPVIKLILGMYIKSFQELVVWERAKELSILTYPIAKNIVEYSYRDQLNRAVLSISNNIAEGFGRRSKKEFKRFLNISLGSTYEVNSMLLIFKDLKLISDEFAVQALALVKNIIALLIGLISKIII